MDKKKKGVVLERETFRRLLFQKTHWQLLQGHVSSKTRAVFFRALGQHYPGANFSQLQEIETEHYLRNQQNTSAYLSLCTMLLSEEPPIALERVRDYLSRAGSFQDNSKDQESLHRIKEFMEKQQADIRQVFSRDTGGTNCKVVCPTCGGDRMDTVERQNRSADEAGAQNHICLNCGTHIEIQR